MAKSLRGPRVAQVSVRANTTCIPEGYINVSKWRVILLSTAIK